MTVPLSSRSWMCMRPCCPEMIADMRVADVWGWVCVLGWWGRCCYRVMGVSWFRVLLLLQPLIMVCVDVAEWGV